MIKCVIVDDDAMSRMILKEFIAKDNELELVQEFDNPVKAINYIKNNSFDLLFLDIEMPEMTGIELIETLNKKIPQTIFTTSYTDFAISAFEYNVSGYLVKPFQFSAFCKAVLKVKEVIQKAPLDSQSYLFVKNGPAIVKINIGELQLIECIGDYVNLYTEKNKYTVHSTMKAMENKFSEKDFIRVHRSYMIRIDKIEEIEDDCISFGKKQIPIGKTYKQDVYSRLKIL